MALSLNDMLLNGNRQPSSQPKSSSSDEEAQSGGKKCFQPYHAQSVPKSENLEAQASVNVAAGKPTTTMMLRNIPNKYTQNTLLQEIDDLGFVGQYDFFYLPMDVHNRSNVGYAFVNFMEPQHAERFRVTFADHRFQRFQSRKISSVCVAHVQGLDENLRHFENRAVTHARNDQYRPIVFRGSVRVDFEEAVAEAKSKLNQVPDGAGAHSAGFVAPMASSRKTPMPPAGLSANVSCGISLPGLLPLSTGVHAVPRGLVGMCGPKPEVPCAGLGGRQDLEAAIRHLLTPPMSPQQGPEVMAGALYSPQMMPLEAQPALAATMPGLALPPGLQQTGAYPGGSTSDIPQLLSLRNLLVERLLQDEKMRGHYAAGAYPFRNIREMDAVKATGCSWEDPAYVTVTGVADKMGRDHFLLGQGVADFDTPRTNGLMLRSALESAFKGAQWQPVL